MRSLTLYGKPGCCLCDEAREAVAAVRLEQPFDLEEVDVSLDPALRRRYGERIPVLAWTAKRRSRARELDPDPP